MHLSPSQRIGALILIAVGAVGLVLWSNRPAEAPGASETPAVSDTVTPDEIVTLSIEGLSEDRQVPITEGETVFEVLERLDSEEVTLQLETETYASMGTLVVGMGGIVNGQDGEYWQYTVNGEMPQVGADQYELSGGDRIEWYFGPSEF